MADLVCKPGTHKVAHQHGEKSRFTYTCEPDTPAFVGTPASAPTSAAVSSYVKNDSGCYTDVGARGWKRICSGK